MRISLRSTIVAGTVAGALLLTGCGTTADGGSAASADGAVTGLRVMVGNSPGSGYDTTARTVAKVMEEDDLAENVEVFNLEGAGGTVALQRLVNEEGNGDLILQMGLGVVGAQYSNKSEATLDQTTPIARLIEEAEAIVVPADSPYQDLDDLVAAWTADPGGTPGGGASNPGGPDHLVMMLLAQEAGIDPAEVNFVSYDGGGELLAAVLGSQLAFATTGVGEVTEQAASGEVRILAVTGEEPVEGVDAPTLTEAGTDLVFTNWRGVVAPAGLSEEQTQRLVDVYTEMHGTDAWKQALADNGWTDAFMTGEEYTSFIASESERVAGVLGDLGLA
jgi:putative tricarboxylic transport membrane protein